MDFDWDERKAKWTEGKRGITFEEAQTVFADFFALTVSDPNHSDSEDRYITLGVSDRWRYLVVSHTYRGEHTRIISARLMTPNERRDYELKEVREMRPEYSSDLLRKGVRGKFYKQYHEGTNVIHLDRDTKAAFPDSKAVNDALRELLALREQVKRSA